VPGRLNQVSVFIKRPGIFFGQCSEICGINHGFMPITIVAIPLELYFWERFYYSVV
jgi:heme/copper-type cytochrome/quinol oxidase subunit 2